MPPDFMRPCGIGNPGQKRERVAIELGRRRRHIGKIQPHRSKANLPLPGRSDTSQVDFHIARRDGIEIKTLGGRPGRNV